MKSPIIYLLVLFFLAPHVIAQKNELSQKYFNEKSLVWQKEFQGTLEDADISKSGHVAVAAYESNSGVMTIYYYSPTGDLIHHFTNLDISPIEKIGYTELTLAQDGNKLRIDWGGDWERNEIIIMDSTGGVLFQRDGGMSCCNSIIMSSNGRYLTDGKRLYFLDGPLKKIEVPGYDQGWKYSYYTITDNIVAVQFYKYNNKAVKNPNARKEWAKIKSVDSHAVLYDLNKNIVLKEYETTPGGRIHNAVQDGDNIFLIFRQYQNLTLDQKETRMIYMDQNGNHLWENNEITERYFSGVPYIGTEFITIKSGENYYVLNKNDGKICKTFDHKSQKEYWINRCFSITTTKEKIFISGDKNSASNKINDTQKNTLVIDCNDAVTEEVSYGFIKQAEGNGPLFVYYSDNEVYNKETHKFLTDHFVIDVLQ